MKFDRLISLVVFAVFPGSAITQAQLPTIIEQPRNVTVVASYPATLSLTATGFPLSPTQWIKDGVVVGQGASSSTATSATISLRLASVAESDAGSYTAVVRNPTGAVTSSPAILTVEPALVISTLAGRAPIGSDDGAATVARFSSPRGIVADADGNVYVADTGNHTIRKVTPQGVVSTLAGAPGVSGSTDGNAATARFSSPSGLAWDAAGTLYIADWGNHTIRKLANGMVSTIAGTARQSGAVDGIGPAARFNLNQSGVAVDDSGNIFVADSFNRTIRKITASGVVTTIAGSAGQVGNVDAQGSAARFSFPYGVAVDRSGNVYVADWGNTRTIRKISPEGVVSTIAGSENLSIQVRDGAGAAALFAGPAGLSLDSSGNIYVADAAGYTIRRISPSGMVTTIAGKLPGSSGSDALGSTDGAAGSARFNLPWGLAAAPDGNVYVADTANHAIRKITAGSEVSTVAGAPSGYRDGLGWEAKFAAPSDVAVDRDRNVYVVDPNNRAIRKISAAREVSTLPPAVCEFHFPASVAPGGQPVPARTEIIAPTAVAVDDSGNVYVAFQSARTIRKVLPTGEVSTLAGSPLNPSENIDGPALSAAFRGPRGVAVDRFGNVFVSDFSAFTIRKISPDGNVVTFAGAAGQRASADGEGRDARFMGPQGIAVDLSGNVYVADSSALRKISPAGVVSTIVAIASEHVAVDRSGTIYFTQPNTHTLRKIDALGAITLVAGPSGTNMAGSADGSGAAAGFFGLEGIAVDQDGVVYVADTSNHTIRKGMAMTIASPVVPPLDPTLNSVNRGSPEDPLAGWTRRNVNSSALLPLRDVVFDGGRFVSVGSGWSVQSVDGATWSTPSSTGLTNGAGIAYGAGRYVVVGNRGNNVPAVAHSADASSWQAGVVTPVTGTFQGVAFGGGRFVAVGTSGLAATSVNGINWTFVATGITESLTRVHFNGDRFVAVGNSGQIISSSDGTAWAATRVNNESFRGVTSQRGRWYAIARGSATSCTIYGSNDALTWSWVVTLPMPGDNIGVADDALVIVGLSNKIAVSNNGAYWNISQAGTDGNDVYSAIASSGSAAVMVGFTQSVTPLLYQTRIAPRIYVQPASQAFNNAPQIVLSVTATTGVGVSYQWRKDGAPLPGGTGATLTVTNTGASALGAYTVTVSNSTGSITSSPAIITAVTPNPGRLVNLAIRSQAGAGNQTLIIGVALGGAGTSGNKRVLFRAIGPTLGQFGVEGFLADPFLTVAQGGATVAANDNWGGTSILRDAFSQVGAFALENTSKDSSAVIALAPSSYTVQIRGAGSETGTTLAEIYELTGPEPFTGTSPRLVNLSARTQVTAGAPLIAGFVIGGATSRTVLVRAVGPTLSAFGLEGVLADPKLELYSGATLLNANDNWGGAPALAAAFGQVGSFALEASSKDSSLLITLEPGSYTAQISGEAGRSGVVLVEIYEVPQGP